MAGKKLKRLEYPADQIRNKCCARDHDEATRRKISTKKAKISALKEALAASDERLAVIEAKCKALMKNFREEQKHADTLARKEIEWDSHKRQKTLKCFFKPVMERATTSTTTAHVDAAQDDLFFKSTLEKK